MVRCWRGGTSGSNTSGTCCSWPPASRSAFRTSSRRATRTSARDCCRAWRSSTGRARDRRTGLASPRPGARRRAQQGERAAVSQQAARDERRDRGGVRRGPSRARRRARPADVYVVVAAGDGGLAHAAAVLVHDAAPRSRVWAVARAGGDLSLCPRDAALSYAHLAYGHQLSAALLMAGIGSASTRSGGPAPAAVKTVPRGRCPGGGLAALAVTVEYGAVFAALPIAITLSPFVRERRGRFLVGAAVAGAVVPILALCAYHDSAFGSPFSTGYHHVINPAFAHKHGQGSARPRVADRVGFSRTNPVR